MPARTGADPISQPGEEVSRSQEMGSTVGTPRCRSVTSEPRPSTQSAEPQIRVRPALITSVRYLAPTLKVQVLAIVETTSASNTGSSREPKVLWPEDRLSTTPPGGQLPGLPPRPSACWPCDAAGAGAGFVAVARR